MTNEQIKKIISNGKPSFYRLKPINFQASLSEAGGYSAELPNTYGEVITQNQYLRELHPSGHAIFNSAIYPDKYVEQINEETGEVAGYQIEKIARIAIPFQQVIRTKTKNHLTGNNLQFTPTTLNPSPQQKEQFISIQQKFIDKNMNIAFAEMVDGQLGTGDSAIYFFRDGGKLDWEVFSFEKGDFLIPYYNSVRRLEKLYRYFSVKTEDGKDEEAFMEINKTHVIEYRKKRGGKSEWVLESGNVHGFTRVPAVYKRGKVAWDDVQGTIEETEWAFSQFCESNAYFAFPILFVAGQVDSAPKKDVQGKILEVSDPNVKVNYLERTAGSNEVFKYQLEQMINFIFMGSFTVNITPDILKSSGDMPGSAIRIVLNHEIDKAIELSKEWDSTIDEIKELFIEGIGLEDKKASQYKDISFRLEIKIYVPENVTELVSNLNLSVSNKTLSKETAQQKHPYAAPDEYNLFKSEQELEAEREIKISNSTKTTV